MRTIYFDIGACNGHQFLSLAQADPSLEVYCFEPDPTLYPNLPKLPNFRNYPFAISETPGKVSFNVCPDSGCSSLLEFTEDINKKWKSDDPLWGYKRVSQDENYRSFYYTQRVEVEAIRLDTFIEQNDIPHIDFLHIDTQGSDLAVLKSLGKYLSIVAEGMIEVPASPDMALYAGQHTKEEAIDFLRGAGFEIVKVFSNDPLNAEENVVFKR